jgi:hypothetical protein
VPWPRLLLILWAFGCTASLRPGPPPEPAREPARHPVPGWGSWPRVNPKRFQSKGHGYLWVDIHVAPGHRDAYARSDGVLLPGFQVVVAGYDNATAPLPAGLTTIVREPDGWHYAVLSPDGREATLQGAIEACIGCHRHAPRSPIFGLRVSAAAGPGP